MYPYLSCTIKRPVIRLREFGSAGFLITAYLYFISFEWLLWSFFPGLKTIEILRAVFDFIPLLILNLYILYQSSRLKKFEFYILSAFAVITVLALISVLLEKAPLYSWIKNMGVTIRFLPFLVISRLSPGNRSLTLFLKNVRFLFWFHAFLCLAGLILGDNFMDQVLLPDKSIFSVDTPTGYWRNTVSTTFVNSIELSFFILAITVLLVANSRSIREKYLILGVALFMAVLSNSVASVLSVFIIAGLNFNKKDIVFPVIMLVSILVIMIGGNFLINYFSGMSSAREYIEVSNTYNRIGYFTKLLPEFFKNGSFKDIVLGMGIDADVVNRKLETYSNLPLMLTYGDNNLKLLKDVFWISILITQGVISLVLIIITLLYISSVASLNDARSAGIIRNLVILVFILGIYNQVLDVKSFSFLFWTILGFYLSKSPGDTDPASEKLSHTLP